MRGNLFGPLRTQYFEHLEQPDGEAMKGKSRPLGIDRQVFNEMLFERYSDFDPLSEIGLSNQKSFW